VSAWSKFNFKK